MTAGGTGGSPGNPPGQGRLETLLRERRVIVLIGSGGVGKTTLAAALGLEASLRGRSTLVLTIDPARRLANALGFAAFTEEEQEISPGRFAAAGLRPSAPFRAMMLDTKRVSDRLVETHAPNPEVRDAILRHPLYVQASTAVAGSHDYMAVELLHEQYRRGVYDLIVLDTPPLGHAVQVLDAPRRLAESLDGPTLERVLRPLVNAGRKGFGLAGLGAQLALKGVSRFSGLEPLRNVAEFLLALSGMFGGIKDRSRAALDLLASEESTFLVATSPDALTAEEALHLRRVLLERHLPFGGFVVNKVRTLVPSVGEGPLPDPSTLAERLRAGEPALRILGPARLHRLVERLLRNLEEEWRLAEADQTMILRLREVVGGEACVVAVPLLDEEIHSLRGLHDLGSLLLQGDA